jgi:hypothetical protein
MQRVVFATDIPVHMGGHMLHVKMFTPTDSALQRVVHLPPKSIGSQHRLLAPAHLGHGHHTLADRCF